MKGSYNHPEAPEMSVSDSLRVGTAMYLLNEYMGRYCISFQFWGSGNNNVYIEKDGVELYSAGGEETPFDIMTIALNYLDKINRKNQTND